MKQFFKVLKFELGNYFHSKMYLLGTLLIALLFVIILSVPSFIKVSSFENMFGGDSENEKWIVCDTGQILDHTLTYKEYLPDVDLIFTDNVDEIKEQLLSEEAAAGFVLNSPTDYTYYINNNRMTDSRQMVFQDFMAEIYHKEMFTAQNFDYDYISAIYETPITSTVEILGKDSAGNYFYAYTLVIILYIMIVYYGNMIATSVTQEKSTRAIEVLITSTGSNSLVFGKVLAATIASLFQVGVMLGSALIAYQINREAWDGMMDMIFNIPSEVLVAFFLFGFTGYVFYAFIFGALGALASKTEDVSKVTGTALMLVMIGFFISMFTLTNGDSMLSKVTSFLPFTSCYSMVVRAAVGTVSVAETIISYVILLVSTVLAALLGSKIYRMGTLLYGNPIKLSNAFKMLKHHE